MITQCISSCQDIVTEFCSIEGNPAELQADCAAECSGSKEWSFINGSLIGLTLIGEKGCDQYFTPPVVHRESEITIDELADIALLCVGVLVLLAVLPKPIFI